MPTSQPGQPGASDAAGAPGAPAHNGGTTGAAACRRLSIILWQGWAAACCATAAANYRMGGAEALLAPTVLALFYLVLGASYGLSAAILISDGSLVLGGPPENWADKASRLIAAVTFIGIGSVLLVLDQRRFARRRDGLPTPA